ncbi:hypothetical protein [Rivularia sp. UHCC 0363]|uniref:hypothetical protein n=1 Tax=Rivularia sp. UHCC 0363 TaxID=3110244 RepID=UPI002B21E763|nr:hypothetical protein [Rivularia sp. UHCC 0363]MEA5597050.1 hypothetical protein [Rivularia sp. UHCC 0363]
MSEHRIPEQKNRRLERALSNTIVDKCFEDSESWLRAILRMCIFSLGYIDSEPVFIVECPNQAVAKRLSRKTYPFRDIVYYFTDNLQASERSLFCYQESKGSWQCFDTNSNSWKNWNSLQTSHRLN